MSAIAVPSNADEALRMLESALGFLAAEDAAEMPGEAVAECLRALERADAVEAAARGRLLEAFDAQDAHLADGQRTTRTWLVHTTRVTKGQAGEYQAIQALARGHQVLLTGLAEGYVLTKSVALQLARWTRAIPDEYRGEAEEILVAAARAGADLRSLAAICAEIRARTAQPDPNDDGDLGPDRGVSLDTTLDGAGVIHGDLSPQCAAMVQAVLDALSAPAGGGDLRTRPQRYHDALAEAMRRLGKCVVIAPGIRFSTPTAGCRAQSPRCVIVLSSVPFPISAYLRADAREGAGWDDHPERSPRVTTVMAASAVGSSGAPGRSARSSS